MSVVASSPATPDAVSAIKAALSEKSDGVLESLAEQYRVRYRTVLDCLGVEHRHAAPSSAFDLIWHDMTTWGPVTFIVHTVNGVFETKASLPSGTHGRGYFNIHGASPIGGHLKIERCAGIYFIDRPFFGRRSCSIQFIDCDGEAMFKVFVGRDANRDLLPEQLAQFESLRRDHAADVA